MGNKKKNIIIWILSWALLFLVVAYSPIGRPDLYGGASYNILHTQGGVSFKDGIANAPKASGFSSVQDNDIEVQTYTPASTNAGESAGNASKFISQNGASYSGDTESASSSQNGNSNYSQMMGFTSSKQQAQGTATAQDNNVSSLTANLSSTSLTGNRRQTQAVTGGGVDWGGDPTGPPIPVGNEWWLLLIMAGAYAFWKQRRL